MREHCSLRQPGNSPVVGRASFTKRLCHALHSRLPERHHRPATGSIVLSYGDADAFADDPDSLASAIAAAKAASEPLYVYDFTTDGAAPFLYEVIDNASPDHWRDLTVPPTAALYKDGRLITVWGLDASAPAEVAEHLARQMGGDANGPIPVPGANGWELVHCDSDAFTTVEALAAVYDDQPSAVTDAASEHGMFQDAVLLSPFDPDDPAYAGEMIVSLGAHRESVNWKSTPMTPASFLGMAAVHRESPHKDGPAFVMADIAGYRRTKVAVKAVYGVGLDFDVGTPGSKII